jgi:adenylate cyclase
MAKEIERKFLVRGDGWRAGARPGVPFVQGYLSTDGSGATVRVRVAGDRAFLTVKGRAKGLTRDELEYEVPVADARDMLGMCGVRVVEKTRYVVPHEGHDWEVDVFEGANAPLVMAEIELGREDEPFARPPWAGDEVTEDGRYANACLATQPYSAWGPKSPRAEKPET